MTVVAVPVSTHPRCKICKSPNRKQIDNLRAAQLNGGMNLEEFLSAASELVGEEVNIDNRKSHFGTMDKPKHTRLAEKGMTEQEQVRDAELNQERDDLAERTFTRVLGEEWRERTPTNEEYLELVRALSVHDLFIAVKSGEKVGITVDQGLKSVGEATKRKHDTTRDELLLALAKAAGGGAPLIGIPEKTAETVEYEVIEESPDLPEEGEHGE